MRHRTGFPELDRVLDRLVEGASAVLGPDLIGAYLVGSFAVGDADEHSDVDVLLPVARPPTPVQEAGLRALHAELPAAEGHWNRELEGSYPPVAELRTVGALGRPWLYVDRGSSVMEWSTHCNTLEHRWTLRHRGVAPAGPPPAAVVDELPPGALREEMRRQVPGPLAPEWRPLIEAALAGRAIGWDPDDVPEAEAVAQTERFARYAARVAADLCTGR